MIPFGAEAQGGVLPPLRAPGGYYPLYPPPLNTRLSVRAVFTIYLDFLEQGSLCQFRFTEILVSPQAQHDSVT